MRHNIKLGLWRPLLALTGATRARSYVDVTGGTVHFRLGSFAAQVPRNEVAAAARGRWPAYGGIGWRIGPGVVGLIGALSNIVEIQFRTPQRMRVLLIPVAARRLFVSLDDPEAFLADLDPSSGRRTAEVAGE